jgi:hypothetical protein
MAQEIEFGAESVQLGVEEYRVSARYGGLTEG